jgi:hypothetical protein
MSTGRTVVPRSFIRNTFRDWRAVLACAGLGNHAGLAHAFREQDLGEGVVDLVRAGMTEVFALEVDLRAAQMLGETPGKIERRGPADEFPVIELELGQKALVLLCG